MNQRGRLRAKPRITHHRPVPKLPPGYKTSIRRAISLKLHYRMRYPVPRIDIKEGKEILLT